jgi:hypothetical protein
MLEPLPSRSVARFMIPLADVMTVLFSLFLVMPQLERLPEEADVEDVADKSNWTVDDQQKIRQELARYRQDLEQARNRTQRPISEQYHTIVLEIDTVTGELLFPQGTRVDRLKDEETIERRIRQQSAARGGGKEMLYILRARTGQGLTYEYRDKYEPLFDRLQKDRILRYQIIR